MEGFSSSDHCERDAVFEEDGAEFCDCGRAVHVRHRVVDGTDCRAGVDSCVLVYGADFSHSVRRVSDA
jgi:hypothetical protein